jgi:Icc-related predicted phosphoesterase
MTKRCHFLFAGLPILAFMGMACSRSVRSGSNPESGDPVSIETNVSSVFTFVAFGDTRFHDPSDSTPADPAVRHALVSAIDKERPAFISIGGDIVYSGENSDDWRVWESETAVWREHRIPIYPALGNHDLKGDLRTALGNYFAHFPELKGSRFYSVRTENTLTLILDSAFDELSGTQGVWLRSQLDRLPSNVDFVFLVFHHPVYTHSSDDKAMGGGHSARPAEQALGQFLEERQKKMRARIVVFNGHVHNYERYEHGGVTYFVTGGGGARPYSILRHADDPYKDPGVNYHYLLMQIDHGRLTVSMHKLEFRDGKEVWSQPDSVTIAAPAASSPAAR